MKSVLFIAKLSPSRTIKKKLVGFELEAMPSYWFSFKTMIKIFFICNICICFSSIKVDYRIQFIENNYYITKSCVIIKMLAEAATGKYVIYQVYNTSRTLLFGYVRVLACLGKSCKVKTRVCECKAIMDKNVCLIWDFVTALLSEVQMYMFTFIFYNGSSWNDFACL